MTAPRRRPTKLVPPRRTLLDSLTPSADRNLFCSRADLSNEATVEAFFANRLLKDLGYRDAQVQTKKSIGELTVSLGGSKSVKYKPDYVLTYRKKPLWVMDAKSTTERPEDWTPQCSGYCLALNQSFTDANPVRHFVLTNGISTFVYEWDRKAPVLELAFRDFQTGNPKYEQLRGLLAADRVLPGDNYPERSASIMMSGLRACVGRA